MAKVQALVTEFPLDVLCVASLMATKQVSEAVCAPHVAP